MINKETIKISYPRFTILLYLNWLLYTNIPFLGFLRPYFIYIEIPVSILLLFVPSSNIKESLKVNIPFLTFISFFIIASIATNSIVNKNMWITLLLLLAIYIFLSKSDTKEIGKLFNDIYISLNIITVTSFIGIMLVLLTDIENSQNYIVSYSMGNFVQNGRFYGLLNNYNALGPIAALTVLISILKIWNSEKNIKQILLHSILSCINIFIVLGSSFTSTIALIACLIVIPVCSIKKNRKKILLILIGVLFIAFILFVINIDFLSELLHKDLRTATLRTQIWSNCIEITNNNALFGLGSFEKYQAYATENNIYMHIAGAHNQYLEIALLYGYPAMILYIAAIVLTLYRILKCYFANLDITETTILLPIVILVFFIIHGLSEGQVMFTHNPCMVIFLTTFLILNKILKEQYLRKIN